MCFGLSEMKVLRLWYVHTRVNSGLLKFSWKQQSSQKKFFFKFESYVGYVLGLQSVKIPV